MTNVKILNMINENKLDELKKMLIEEIYLEKNKEVPIYKAIQKFSKLVGKEMIKERPVLAGANYVKDLTQITNGFCALFLNGHIEGLRMVPEGSAVDLTSLIPDIEQCIEVVVNINLVKNNLKINKEDVTVVLGRRYNSKYLVLLSDCIEDCKYYVCEKFNGPVVLLKGVNGCAILLPLRV